MNVTLRQLRAMVALAETGSFTAAARRLNLTPSALSLLIKELESSVDVRLFERSTRHLGLTAAGEELLPLTRKVLDDLDQALESARELQQLQRGTVRIACTPLYAATLMPELIARYRDKYPAIGVLVLDSLNREAQQRVASGEADFGIAPQRATPPELVQRALMRDRVSLFCREDHPLAANDSVTWAQVLREPFVSLTQDFTSRLQADLLRHSAKLVLQSAHSVSFFMTALGMVRAGYGITAQPESAEPLATPFGLVMRRIVAPVVYRQVSILTRKNGSLSPAAESFLKSISESLK